MRMFKYTTNKEYKSCLVKFSLLGIVSFFIIANLIWLSLDTLPPAWDQSHHMLLSLKYYKLIKQGLTLNNLRNFLSIEHYYPPFFHVSAVPIIFIIGFSEAKITFVNFIYLFLLVISVYGIGKILFNPMFGVIAALLTLFYPLVFALSRQYLIDFALFAMVTSVQCLILRSGGGIKKPWNLFLGIMAGFALLTKGVSAIFIFPLWIFILLSYSHRCKDILVGFFSIAISLLIALPWYLVNFRELLNMHLFWQHHAVVLEHDPTAFIPSFLLYGQSLKSVIMSQNLWIFFILGLFLFLVFDRRWKIFLILLLMVIPAWLILILTPNKNERYIVPSVHAFAILTCGGINIIKQRFVRNILCAAIVIIGVIQCYDSYFNTNPILIKCDSWFFRTPIKEDWKAKEILEDISSYCGNRQIVLGILSDWHYFNPNTFILYNEVLNLPYIVEGVGYSPVTIEQVKRYDIFVTKFPNISPGHLVFNREKIYREMNELGVDKLGLKIFREFTLPDNSKAIVYIKESILNK